MITLTHSVQVRRFTSDLLRVLKGQSLQRVSFVNFPAAYEKVFHKTFKPAEYGLCDLEDLLAEIPDGTVTVDEVNTIAIPKREQTAEQVERTNQFRSEIEEFLCQSPYCSILFDKFIPAYHRHFARQCKVSDYGFTKLVELFEAIPETVEVEEVSDTERRVKLKLQTALEVLGGQIRSLILQSNFSTILISEMVDVFKQTHGYTLKALPYQCQDLTELVLKLDDFIQVTYSRSAPLLSVVNVDNQVLEIRTWTLLRHPPYKCGLSKFKYEYRIRFLTNAPIRQLKGLTAAVRISQENDQQIISLGPLHILCAQLYQILYRRNGSVELNKIPDLYFKEYGSVLSARRYKVNSFDNLFRQIKFLVNFQKNGNKTFLVLNKNLRNFGVPVPSVPKQSEPWPPLPAHVHLSNFIHRAPPKPDTPPPEGSWNPASNYPNEDVEPFHVYLPELEQPKCDVNDGLISPSAFGVFFPSQPTKKYCGTTEFTSGKNAFLDDSGYGGFSSFGRESPINSANIP
ncbi:meiosis regulator and mRNA stability factor 1-like [Photinus pyralis]|nr:meiosis regulator and mRNA stability factor 1-like [Photinus pyralis]